MREHLAAVSRNAVRPSVRDRFFTYGADPVRILLTGNGIALGYGVSRRSDTLDAHIGARIALATRRGVVVNNHTHDSSKLAEQTMQVLAGVNLQSEDVVVWCPSYSEVLERSGAGYWGETMGMFVGAISRSVSVVIVEVPIIETEDFDARAINAAIRRINRALRESARASPNVEVFTPPAVQFVIGRSHLYDAAYYESVGEALARIVLRRRFGIRALPEDSEERILA